MIDKEIIKGCLDNNRDSQKTLYDEFYGKMIGVCMRYSTGEDEAHEMLQEGFLKVFKNFKNYKESETLELWVKKNVIEGAIKYIRDDKNKKSIVSTVYANKMGKEKPVEMSDSEIVMEAEQGDFLNAVQQLSSGYRIVFNLFFMDGYSHAEIAEMLDISEDTSKTNFEKAKYSFRKNLIQHLSSTNGK
jgi:RNA polymerase sigma-70 factor (ECF subfamily)